IEVLGRSDRDTIQAIRFRGALTPIQYHGKSSSMTDGAGSDLDRRIAGRVRDLRASRGLTLEGLTERSGVSRSMISLIARGESSATAVLLERLATGLSVPLASL